MKANPITFYAAILAYLESDTEDEKQIAKILELDTLLSPSWETTTENIQKLEQCVNRSSEVKDDDEWSMTTNDFVKASFKDLSVLRDPAGMTLFDNIGRTCLPTYANGEDLFIHAKSIKERQDGSGVIILHVSNLERFRKILEDHDNVDSSTCLHTLEEGIQIGS